MITRSARHAGAILCLAGVVIIGASVAPGGADAAAAAPRNGWTIVPSANGSQGGTNTLVQVSAGSAGYAWAVGYGGGPGGFRTLIQRWNGTRWTATPSPSPSSLDNVLFGVDTVSRADAWAVGYDDQVSSQGSYHKALIEHWNGTAWRVVPGARLGARDSDLWGVTALSATNVWAVGNQNIGNFRFRPLVEHWNGTTWTRVRVPSPALLGVGASLFGVAATSPRDIWAVGNYATGTGIGFKPLIEHWNGRHWSRISVPTAGSATLNRISMLTPTDGWAVGSRGAVAHTQPLIEHWNGHRWSTVKSPLLRASSLADVVAVAPHLAWAVGSHSPRSGVNRTLIERWNGRAWTITHSPNRRPSSELLGIAGTRQHFWAVGDSVTSTLILRHSRR